MRNILLVFFFCFFVYPCRISQLGTVRGQIVESVESEPVSHIRVKLQGSTFSAISDSNGNFEFRKIPPGTYNLLCDSSLQYLDTILAAVVVGNDSTTQITIALQPRFDEITVFETQAVQLSSLKPEWQLFKGAHGIMGTPVEAFQKLIAVRGTTKRVLLKNSSLKGFVSIMTAEQALEFVRLFTNMDTFTLFHVHGGENLFLEVRMNSTKPSWGDLNPSDFQKLGMTAPVISRVGGTFFIERYVFAYDRHFYRIQERVSSDGEYVIVKRKMIETKIELALPMYF